MLQYIVTGLAVGSLYAMLGLGLCLTQRSTNVLNFAQGEMAMAMAFVAFIFASTLGWPLLPAFLATAAIAAVVGFLLYNLVIYPNRKRDHVSLTIVTLGIKLALTGSVAWVFGVEARIFPPLFSVDRYEIHGLMISPGKAWTIIAGIAAMIALVLFLRYTRLGLAMRASADNVDVAQLLGVNLRVAGSITGVLLASSVILSPYMMGLSILKGFAALVIGGMTSIPGVIVGGLLVGVTESMVAYTFSPLLQESSALVLIILVLLIRPQGLFGEKSVWRA